MEVSTTIREMMANNEIYVPDYQRAYSWETPEENTKSKTHTDVFYADIEEYKNSKAKAPFYFGHFLYEEKSKNKYAIIDGQQRLTTIVIFLSVLFEKLQIIRELSEDEKEYDDFLNNFDVVLFRLFYLKKKTFDLFFHQNTKLNETSYFSIYSFSKLKPLP